MTTDTQPLPRVETRDSWMNDPKVRSAIIQIALIAAIFAFGWWIVSNTARNLQAANIASGFGFIDARAGFDISQLPIEYSSNSTYGRALIIGTLNTLIIAGAGIVLATLLGFAIGIGRLSQNVLVRGVCTVYVETFRNIPPLLVILFWYFGVLAVLPSPREAIELPFSSFLSNRGFQMPRAVFEPGAGIAGIAILIGILATFVLSRIYKKRQMETGERRGILLPAIGLIVGVPLIVFLAIGAPATIEFPVLGTFNVNGGFQVSPQFLALFLALSVYTAAFIAEIVRAGILAVSHGQTEAASALGLRRGLILRLVVVPQAFRVIIPPLTSQYLNLTKNSSLGLAVGYPELVAIGSTVLNQSGQSIEVVVVWMTVYLGLSLTVSFLMNWFNRSMMLVER